MLRAYEEEVAPAIQTALHEAGAEEWTVDWDILVESGHNGSTSYHREVKRLVFSNQREIRME